MLIIKTITKIIKYVNNKDTAGFRDPGHFSIISCKVEVSVKPTTKNNIIDVVLLSSLLTLSTYLSVPTFFLLIFWPCFFQQFIRNDLVVVHGFWRYYQFRKTWKFPGNRLLRNPFSSKAAGLNLIKLIFVAGSLLLPL